MSYYRGYRYRTGDFFLIYNINRAFVRYGINYCDIEQVLVAWFGLTEFLLREVNSLTWTDPVDCRRRL